MRYIFESTIWLIGIASHILGILLMFSFFMTLFKAIDGKTSGSEMVLSLGVLVLGWFLYKAGHWLRL